jgi:hypothetical protein
MSELSRNIADLATMHVFLDRATNALEVPEYVRAALSRLGNRATMHAMRQDVSVLTRPSYSDASHGE